MDALILQILNGLDKGLRLCADRAWPDPDFRHARCCELRPRRAVHDRRFLRGLPAAACLSISTVTLDETQKDGLSGQPAEDRNALCRKLVRPGNRRRPFIDWSVPLAILFAIPVMIAVGFIMERGLIKHFYKRPHADQILVTFGLAIVLQEVIKYFYGANPIPTPAPDSLSGACRLLVRSSGFDPNVDHLSLLAHDLLRFRDGDHRGRLCLPAIYNLRHGRPRRHGRPGNGLDAGDQHRQALYHDVRHRCRRGWSCRCHVYADQPAQLSHGDGLPGP